MPTAPDPRPDRALATAVGHATDSSVHSMTIVHGGDTAAAFRVDLADGRRLFAKTHPSPPPGFFTTEAASLRWLRDAGALPVPEVVAVSDGSATDPDEPPMLVLEWIEEAGRGAHVDRRSSDAALGDGLARLHAAGAPSFGREDRRVTGSRGLPNEPHPTWSSFLAECRLLPLARMARDAGAMPAPVIARLERLAASLARFDDGAPPSRLHGDLWAGNRLVDRAGTSWLVDPAAHGGHREFDLAMMRLFGGYSDACFDAYAERSPLAAGWRDRVALHQIAPLVVHAVKFGGSYVAAAAAAIDAY